MSSTARVPDAPAHGVTHLASRAARGNRDLRPYASGEALQLVAPSATLLAVALLALMTIGVRGFYRRTID